MTQALADTVISWSWIAVSALSFALVFRSTGFLVFTHGSVMTAGAYCFAGLAAILGLGVVPAAGLAVCGAAGVGCLVEAGLYAPLRRRQASPLALFLASLGAVVVIENALSMVFGDAPLCLMPSVTVGEGMLIAGARLSPVRLATFVVGTVASAVVAFCLVRTRVGMAMRALWSDPDLARSSGMAVERLIFITTAIASALAGGIGILVALDVDATPGLGMRLLLPGVVAAIVGGTARWYDPLVGAVLVALSRFAAVWWFSSLWQDTFTFGLLLLVMLVRPGGLAGRARNTGAGM